jgi:helix-turn-helix protein
MRPGKRFGLSAIEKSEIWSRWKAGQSLHEIGRAYGKPHNSIRCVLLPRGGIPPAARRRSRLALTLSEREDISRGIASGSSFREIAGHLDRAVSNRSHQGFADSMRPPLRSRKKSLADVCAFFASASIGVEAIALMERISSLTCFHGVSSFSGVFLPQDSGAVPRPSPIRWIRLSLRIQPLHLIEVPRG